MSRRTSSRGGGVHDLVDDRLGALRATRSGMPCTEGRDRRLGIGAAPAGLGDRVQQADPPAAVALDGDELQALQRRGVAGVVDVGVLAIQHLADHRAERELVDGDAAAERAADHVDHRQRRHRGSRRVSSRSSTSISMPAMSSRSRSSDATSSRRASPATPSTAGRSTDRARPGVIACITPMASSSPMASNRSSTAPSALARAVALGQRRDPERRGQHRGDPGDRDADRGAPDGSAGRLGLDVGRLARGAAARRAQAAQLGGSGSRCTAPPLVDHRPRPPLRPRAVPPVRPADAPQSVEKGPSVSFRARNATASPVTASSPAARSGPVEHGGEHDERGEQRHEVPGRGRGGLQPAVQDVEVLGRPDHLVARPAGRAAAAARARTWRRRRRPRSAASTNRLIGGPILTLSRPAPSCNVTATTPGRAPPPPWNWFGVARGGCSRRRSSPMPGRWRTAVSGTSGE